MYPRRTLIGQLSAGQYHQPSHVDLSLPLTILTTGFASGTNPKPTRLLGVLGGVSGLRMLDGPNRASAKNVRERLDKLRQDQSIERADISTNTTDNAVCFRV